VFDTFPITRVPQRKKRDKKESVAVSITHGNVKQTESSARARARQFSATEESSSIKAARDFYDDAERAISAQRTPLEFGTHFTSSGPHSFAGTHAANKHWCF